MRIPTALIGSSLMVALAIGCSEAPPTLAPVDAPAGGAVPKKTDRGVQVKKHNIPVGPDPNAVTP